MADGFRLPEVIVVLVLLFRISCHPTSENSELLDIVRQSNSDEPEVREFLRNVLKHHNDFRCISHEMQKYNQRMDRASLRGSTSKNKRSFYSGYNRGEGDDNTPPFWHDIAAKEGNTVNVMDHQYNAANSATEINTNNGLKLASKKISINDLDFDGPVNDIYPYQDDLNIPPADKRFVRETEDSFLYNDRDLDDDDLLGESSRMGEELGSNGAGEKDEAEFASEDRHDRSKKSPNTEALLKEKMMLHRVLHSNTENTYKKNGDEFKVREHRFNPLEFYMPGDTIEVLPNSQNGVLYAPGIKLERYGESVKSDINQYHSEDLQADEELYTNRKNVNRRTCAGTLAETDFKVPELFEHNNSQSSDVELPISEFYYSLPHDIIGLNKDMLDENHDLHNASCKILKRSNLYDTALRMKREADFKNKKAININIFDNGELVKSIKKAPGSNSVVLTIKSNSTNSNGEGNTNTINEHQLAGSKSTKENVIDADDSVDNTLQQIDNIIKHDQASLKAHTKTSKLINMKSHRCSGENFHENEGNGFNEETNSNESNESLVDQAHMTHYIYKPNIRNEIGTTIVSYARPAEYLPESGPQTQNVNKTQLEENYQVNNYQNRLEDQTEPTSAAEQRELGKINSGFHTEPINIHTTSEKIYIIPITKCRKSEMTLLEAHVEEDTSQNKPSYRNNYRTNKNQYVSPANIDNSLSDSQMQLSERPYEDDKKKRSDENETHEMHLIPRIQDNYPTADAFRSRKLFVFEENTNDDISEVSRNKKDIRKILKMHKDEDYSEDRIDFYGDDENIKEKTSSDFKTKANNKKRENDMNQRVVGNLINTQQERRALKVRLAKTKNYKFKRDILNTPVEAESMEDAESIDQEPISNEYVNCDNDIDTASKNNFAKTVIKHQSFNQNATSGKDSLDRCCDNNKYDNASSPSFSPSNITDTKELAGYSRKGNEIDIIEKTQAILLHLTELPVDSDFTQEYTTDQHNPLPDVKRLKPKKVTETDKGTEDVKGAGDVKDSGDVKGSGDVVSEIIKLVQNYKNKVNEYNKNQNHYNNNKNIPDRNDILISSGTNTKFDRNVDSYNQYVAHSLAVGLELTTFGPIIDYSIADKVLPVNNQVESNVHGHSINHAKKLHPTKINKCDIKTGKEHIQEFIEPSAVHEVYIKPEVISGADNSEEDWNPNKNTISNELDALKHIELFNIKFNDKTDKKREDILNNNNPLQFTPDNLKSFDDIVERENDKNLQPEDRERVGSLKQIEILDDVDNRKHQIFKRDLNNQDDYAEEELNKLLGMVDDASSEIKSDKKFFKRHRRYKSLEPIRESYPRNLRSDTDGKPESPNSAASYPTSSNSSQQPAKLPPCGDLEYHETQITNSPKKHKKTHHRDPLQTIQEEEEFGKVCKVHSDQPKKTKAQLAHENIDREHTRVKIYEDKTIERQKEQEHIRNVLNGHLLLEIMDKFRNKIKENEKLNNRFGQSMGAKCAADQVAILDRYKEEQGKSDIRHAQLMLHQVIVLMNKIVAEQVHRRTCLGLPPTMKSYLKHITENHEKKPKSNAVAEGYPLPAIKGKKGNTKDHALDDTQGDFLFPPGDDETTKQSARADADNMRKRINMIRALLLKYEHMSRACQAHVQPVHDYLVSQLKYLQKMNHDKKFDEISDACDESCAHEKPTNPPETTVSKAENSVPGQSITPAIGASLGSNSVFSADSVQFVGTSAGLAEETGTDALHALKSKAEVRRATYTPPQYKKNYQQRIFRAYDGDIDVFGDSNSGEYPSEKYRKLVEAAANYRRKRQIEERLVRLFGRSKTKKTEMATTPKLDENMEANLSNAAFEAPMVYSLH